MKKKLISMLLTAAMVSSVFVGCGDNGGAATNDAPAAETKTEAPAAETTTEAPAAEAEAPAADEGTVLNIYCWNEEFKSRLTDHYPGYTAVDGTTGTIGDVTVKWNITPSDDNAYQNNLDATLLGQADAAADDKIDIFLVEADYALKYVDTEYAKPLSDLGITDADFANQYQYTKDVVTDGNGNLKGASWQGCPGVMVYRRDIATEVFGTDDPATIQESFKDWDTFLASAATLKDAGYQAISSANDTYRVFSNNVTSKWVVDGKINIDPNITKWVEMSKAMVDAGEAGTHDLWSDDWNKGFYMDSNVFAYFGPAWLIDFCMAAGSEGSVATEGQWAATVGPQGFYWGGTWICAAEGTDNATLVKDIILKLTTDEAIMTDIVKKDNDFVNNKNVMDTMSADTTYGDAVLGGQNALGMFCEGVQKIDLSNISIYDQGCTEEFQHAMKNYFDGNATYEEALDLFYKGVTEKYPTLTY